MFLSKFTVASDVPSNAPADARAASKASASSSSTVELAAPHKGSKLSTRDSSVTQLCVRRTQ